LQDAVTGAYFETQSSAAKTAAENDCPIFTHRDQVCSVEFLPNVPEVELDSGLVFTVPLAPDEPCTQLHHDSSSELTTAASLLTSPSLLDSSLSHPHTVTCEYSILITSYY